MADKGLEFDGGSELDEGRRAALARIEAWRQRAPVFRDDTITMAHGAGGKASQSLLTGVVLPALTAGDGGDGADDGGDTELHRLDDGAVVDMPDGGHQLVVTTDAFVVTPRFFAGGSIGDLAVNGTVNDLAVMGATPEALTLSLVLEEGLAVSELRRILDDVAAAARAAGVTVVAGDTKVVEREAADGCYLTTTGIGFRRSDLGLGADQVRGGDTVICSGPIGDHGIAVLVARGDLALTADLVSDTRPLTPAVSALLDAVPATRWMRDATRGGVASVLNELAGASGCGVELDEAAVPVRRPVVGACELLGLDPLYIANEGTFVAVVPADRVGDALAALRSVPGCEEAAAIGRIVDDHPRLVVANTTFGGTRILDMLVGDPLPRIC
ncbi:MAG: hydrogenase expression/formation protein HypE [Acidimicrobiia bacterium]|nr:hydrogenase expression/formation protein HypE [Acidimicrobiia bacterium]